MKKSGIFFLILFVISCSFGQAQSIPETPFTSGYSWAVGAKAFGMGGAFTAIADDYSALYCNPAGMGQIKTIDIYGSFSNLRTNDQVTFLGVESDQDANFTSVNSFGVTLPLPTYQGSLVLGFGFQRHRDFGRSFSTDLIPAVLLDFPVEIGGTGYLFDLDVDAGGDEFVEGHLTQTSMGASIEVAEDVFLGGAVNFWSGEQEFSQNYTEIGGIYDLDYNNDSVIDTTIMLTDLIIDNHFREPNSGLNLTLSALIKPHEILRLGAAIKTPVTLTGKRDWDVLFQEDVYPGYAPIPDSTNDGYIDYKIQSPWTFRVGAAIIAGPVTLSGDVELKDYSQIKYKTDPPVWEEGTMSVANRTIRQNFRSTVDYSIGGQLAIPGTALKLRGGFAVVKSPLQEARSAWDRSITSFGLGYSFMENFILDAGYAISSWEKERAPDDIAEKEVFKVNKLLVGITYRI